MSLRLFVAGASAVGAGTLTSYFLLSDNTVSISRSSISTIEKCRDFLEIARLYVLNVTSEIFPILTLSIISAIV